MFDAFGIRRCSLDEVAELSRPSFLYPSTAALEEEAEVALLLLFIDPRPLNIVCTGEVVKFGKPCASSASYVYASESDCPSC